MGCRCAGGARGAACAVLVQQLVPTLGQSPGAASAACIARKAGAECQVAQSSGSALDGHCAELWAEGLKAASLVCLTCDTGDEDEGWLAALGPRGSFAVGAGAGAAATSALCAAAWRARRCVEVPFAPQRHHSRHAPRSDRGRSGGGGRRERGDDAEREALTPPEASRPVAHREARRTRPRRGDASLPAATSALPPMAPPRPVTAVPPPTVVGRGQPPPDERTLPSPPRVPAPSRPPPEPSHAPWPVEAAAAGRAPRGRRGKWEELEAALGRDLAGDGGSAALHGRASTDAVPLGAAATSTDHPPVSYRDARPAR